MEKINHQTDLYKDRVAIKRAFSYLVIEKKQYSFLFSFLKSSKKIVFLATFFLALQAFLEILFIFLSHNVLSVATRPFYQRFSSIFLISGIASILLYVLVVYFSIYYERKFVLGLTNKIRSKMFANILNREVSKVSTKDRLHLIPDFSFDLSLFTLGLDNAGVSVVRWFFYFSAMIVYVVVFNLTYAPYLLVILLVSIVLYLGAYKVANNYISKEAASYSRIIEHIVNSVYNFNLLKKLRMETEAGNILDRVVNVDTYFRIRRDIWIRYSNRIIIILVVIGVAFYGILTNVYAVKINLTSSLFLQGVIFIFIIRLFYLCVRAGIYTTPFKIGISLCVPKNNFSMFSARNRWIWEEITFISNKVKLFPESSYYKNFRISFLKGKRYLFVAPKSFSGKTALAQVFSGEASFSRHSFLVKVGQERIPYNQWAGSFVKKYLFSVYVSSYSTVGEFLFRKNRQKITSEDIELLNIILKQNPIFTDFSLANNFLTNSLEDYATNYLTLFSLHVLNSLLSKPELIVVDNLWIDLNYEEIDNLLQFLDVALPESTIIVFSRQQNKLLNYEYVYTIEKESVQKIIL